MHRGYVFEVMPSFDELSRLSSAQLHHRAIDMAKHRHDIAFFWHLIEYIPEAEAISGSLQEADADVEHPAAWLHDFVDGGGKLDDALRPVYIDYLQHHGEE